MEEVGPEANIFNSDLVLEIGCLKKSEEHSGTPSWAHPICVLTSACHVGPQWHPFQPATLQLTGIPGMQTGQACCSGFLHPLPAFHHRQPHHPLCFGDSESLLSTSPCTTSSLCSPLMIWWSFSHFPLRLLPSASTIVMLTLMPAWLRCSSSYFLSWNQAYCWP